MGKIRVMRVPEFKTLGKDGFIRWFINKPLEPLAETVYEHLLQIYKEKYGLFVLGPEFRNLFAHLTHFWGVVELVENIHNDSWMSAGYKLERPETLKRFMKGADDVLLREMADLSLTTDKIWFSSAERPDLEPILSKWNDLLNLVPNLHNIEYDEDEIITHEYLLSLQATLMTVWEGISRLATQARDIYTDSIIRLVKESGITPNNALYRDIYDCLRMCDLIDEDQVNYHDKSENKYVRENYIKSKYMRLSTQLPEQS